jgi:hypothetical protein
MRCSLTVVSDVYFCINSCRPSIVTAANAALIGAMCGIFCLLVGAVLSVIWMRHRMRHLKAKEKRKAEVCGSVRFSMTRPTAAVTQHDGLCAASSWTTC